MDKKQQIFGNPILAKIRKYLNSFRISSGQKKGFSLIEALLGMFLMGVALMGLAQLFVYSVLNNSRGDEMTTATFLARQQIEQMRNLMADELSALSSYPLDEDMNLDGDSTIDFRRITVIEIQGAMWEIRVLVFPGAQAGVTTEELTTNPTDYKVRADISTTIARN